MISKTFRIVITIVLTGVALSSVAGATCSNASLSGTYGFLHDGTDSTGAPTSAAVSQLTFDPTTGTFAGENTASHAGVIATNPITGTYTIDKNCTGTGIPAGANPFSIVVMSTGFLAVHTFSEGYAVKQGSPACTDAGVTGSYGFETTGIYLAGAPATGAAVFIGELKFTLNASGGGVINGRIAGAVDATALSFADEPVTGYYRMGAECRGTATIKPMGQPEMHFSLVIVDSGKQILAIETDADTVVSGTLQKGD